VLTFEAGELASKEKRMKTHRFGNGSLEKAKEAEGEGFRRRAIGTTGKARSNSAAQCATPARRVKRRAKNAPEKPVTTITAMVDVGFGNSLTIRGEGQGLSWDEGQPMTCVEGATWIWSGQSGTERVKFKVLINDQLWCRGENIEIAAGAKLEVVPAF
jgi:hypothetical protein